MSDTYKCKLYRKSNKRQIVDKSKRDADKLKKRDARSKEKLEVV